MKQVSTIVQYTHSLRQLLVSLGLLILLLVPARVVAQADSTAQSDTTATTEEPAAEEESGLISPSLQFITVQKGDNSIDLNAALQAKVKTNVYKLSLLKISFVLVTDTAEKDLGFVITDRVGKAVLNVKPELLVPDKEGKLHFKAVFAGNKSMDAVEEEITIKKSRLEITPLKEDSLLTVKVKLVDAGTGAPVPETVVGIFVNRSFNPLKIGEGTTDENGEATVEIPANLPGDAKGNISLMAMLEENEVYGNVETAVTQQWGIPISDKLEELPRALWSSHAPLWMMITFIILICTVWGHYLVIIIQLFRLRKEEPDPDSPTVEHIS